MVTLAQVIASAEENWSDQISCKGLKSSGPGKTSPRTLFDTPLELETH